MSIAYRYSLDKGKVARVSNVREMDNFTAFSSMQVSIWRESGSRRPLPRKCQENEGKVLVVTLAGAGMTLLGVLLASPPPTVGG